MENAKLKILLNSAQHNMYHFFRTDLTKSIKMKKMQLSIIVIIPIICALTVEGHPFSKGFNLNCVDFGFKRVSKRETLTNLSSKKDPLKEGKGSRNLSRKSAIPAVPTTRNVTFNERDLVYPALLILLAPSIAPLSEKIFDEIIIAGQRFVGIVLQIVKQIGALFKFSYDMLIKKLEPPFYFVMSVISQTRGLIQDLMHELMVLSFQKFPTFLKGMWEGTCGLSSTLFKTMCTSLARTKELVKLFMCQSISSSVNLFKAMTQEVKTLFILLASVIAEGVESLSRFFVHSISYVVEGAVSTWDMISSFVAHSSEYIWNAIVGSTYTSFYILEEIGEFISDVVANLFENACKTFNSVAKSVLSCIVCTADRIPKCIKKCCRVMPFLEETDNGFVLTNRAQTFIYVASIVGSLYPNLQNEESTISESNR